MERTRNRRPTGDGAAGLTIRSSVSIEQQATERADRAEAERNELRAELARRRAEFVGAQARQCATFAHERHRAEAAEAREAALREALEVSRGSFRKLMRHHRDDHHGGTQPYDQEVATGLWHLERVLAAAGRVGA